MNDEIVKARQKTVMLIMAKVDEYLPRGTQGHDVVREAVMDATDLWAVRMERLIGPKTTRNGKRPEREIPADR